MQKIILFLLLAYSQTVYPMTEQDKAKAAALADGATTLIGVTSGALVELNPIIGNNPTSIIAFTVLKVGVSDHLSDGSANVAKSIWGGASINNLSLLLGASPPVAIVLGVFSGIALYHEGKP